MMDGKISVAVVGAGIIGTSTALCILESGLNVDITLIAENFSPRTTGDGSAGSLFPSTLGPETSSSDLTIWFRETYNYLLNCCKSPEADQYGVGLVHGYVLYKTTLEERNKTYSLNQEVRDVFLNFRMLADKELKVFGDRFKSGFFYSTVYAECAKFIPMMMKRVEGLGGKIVERKVQSLPELSSVFDVVINCAGLGARELVPNDPSPVYPVRGQVTRVKANWIKHMILSPDEGNYIIPNGDEIILGGTKQMHDECSDVRQEDKDRILSGCYSLIPSLENATYVRDWVGFRPGRAKPRIELERADGKNSRSVVIHNYGHGGSGVTLFWGCALQVRKLLEEHISFCKD